MIIYLCRDFIYYICFILFLLWFRRYVWLIMFRDNITLFQSICFGSCWSIMDNYRKPHFNNKPTSLYISLWMMYVSNQNSWRNHAEENRMLDQGRICQPYLSVTKHRLNHSVQSLQTKASTWELSIYFCSWQFSHSGWRDVMSTRWRCLFANMFQSANLIYSYHNKNDHNVHQNGSGPTDSMLHKA